MPESRVYATLDDLKVYLGSSYSETDENRLNMMLKSASAGLRSVFRGYGMDLDKRIESGETEEVIVNQVVVEMVSRSYTMSVSAPLLGDFSQMSSTAGPYQTTVSVSGPGGSMYLRREQAAWLGLPVVSFRSIDLL